MTLAQEQGCTPLPTLYTLDEVADQLHMSASTLRRLVTDRRIRHTKIGGKPPMFTAGQVHELVAAFERRPVQPLGRVTR